MSDRVNVIDKTTSLCPVCLEVIPANIVERRGKVFMEKTCAQHGSQTVYQWPNVDHYVWFREFSIPSRKPSVQTEAYAGCPLSCGLCSEHKKHPTVAEIEVTLRCNLRCPVCFMSAGDKAPEPPLDTIENMFFAIRQNSGLQTAIQLTGGEPTVRKDLPEIIQLGSSIGFYAIEVNTNGIVIGRERNYVRALAEAGISGIYLQFDGLDREIYRRIRGADLLETKLRAIEHCRQAGVQVVLAMTVIAGINESQLGEVLDFALRNQDVIAGVAYQPAFGSGRFEVTPQRNLTMGDVVWMLAEQSRGMLDPYDFLPLGCSHPLCSCSTYLVSDGSKYVPFTRYLTPREYVQYFDAESPQGSVFSDIVARHYSCLTGGLSIVVMNYMDVMNLDIERLKECSMVVVMEDGRMIPFCAYHLCDCHGKRFHSASGKVESLALPEKPHV